jgi:acyl carrier protein
MTNPITEKVLEIIYQAVEQHNDRPSDLAPLEKSKDAVLFGEDGKLDSLQFVSLIVGIEELVQDAFDVPVVLADDRALSRTPSPFQTLGSLADYLVELLEEEGVGQ